MTDPMPARRSVLKEHARECDECTDGRYSVERLEKALASSRPVVDVAQLSRATLDRARPLLARRAVFVYRRRVAASLTLALAPLPLVVVYGIYSLRAMYSLLDVVLPDALATYIVAGYGATLMLLVGMTYAAIPVLVAQAEPAMEGAS